MSQITEAQVPKFRESRLAAFPRDIEERDKRDYARAADLAKHLHDVATFAHVERVAARVRATADPASVGRAAIVAVLHDSVEDTVLTVAVIENICGRDIGDAVNALTRRKDENYLTDYIPRVAAAGELARIVKLADLADHLDPAQAATLKPEKKHRYEAAREILTAAPAQAAHQHRVLSSLSVCN